MDDLDGVLKDSPDDQEMQRMAAEEQQQLQQQVCSTQVLALPFRPSSYLFSGPVNIVPCTQTKQETVV